MTLGVPVLGFSVTLNERESFVAFLSTWLRRRLLGQLAFCVRLHDANLLLLLAFFLHDPELLREVDLGAFTLVVIKLDRREDAPFLVLLLTFPGRAINSLEPIFLLVEASLDLGSARHVAQLFEVFRQRLQLGVVAAFGFVFLVHVLELA